MNLNNLIQITEKKENTYKLKNQRLKEIKVKLKMPQKRVVCRLIQSKKTIWNMTKAQYVQVLTKIGRQN